MVGFRKLGNVNRHTRHEKTGALSSAESKKSYRGSATLDSLDYDASGKKKNHMVDVGKLPNY